MGGNISSATATLAAHLAGWLRVSAPSGLRDIIPSYTSVLVTFDPIALDIEMAVGWCEAACALLESPEADGIDRIVEIPIVYGGIHGPDLIDLASLHNLTPEEAVARHSAPLYTVAAIGFSPGYPYLLGLDPTLATPRLGTPRTRVQPGGVGIGGAQAGIYTMPTPGGWHIIGATPRRMFDPWREPPSLLEPGDRVRFVPIPEEAFVPESPAAHPERSGAEVFAEVIHPGLQTTIQDLGRVGQGHLGVTEQGAMDRTAIRIANRLVGNEDAAAALEITLTGPTLRIMNEGAIALGGADLGVTVNDQSLPPWSRVAVKPGDVIAYRPGGNANGSRAYLAFAGGIASPLVLGSRSTDIISGFGGFDGRALKAGDRLSLEQHLVLPFLSGRLQPSAIDALTLPGGPVELRVVEGPQWDWFGDLGKSLFGSEYLVSSRSDRAGIRLTGTPLDRLMHGDMVSEGITVGSVQIPPDGQPIVLMRGRGTIGGYPKVATVIEADLDLAAQCPPHQPVRFRLVSLQEARAAALSRSRLVDSIASSRQPASGR